MREMGVILRHARGNGTIGGDHFCALGFCAEMNIARGDGVGGLNDIPLFMFVAHGALNELIAAPFETAQAPWGAQGFKVASARFSGTQRIGCGGPGGKQRGFFADAAVAIDVIDLHRSARFAINFSVAVIVLGEMAIVALHTSFEVDVREMDGFAETLWIVEGDLPAIFVEPVALAVVIEDSAEDPAVSRCV